MTRLLSTQQVAERLGVTSRTVYRKHRAWGLMPHPSFLPLFRFRESDVDDLIGRTTA